MANDPIGKPPLDDLKRRDTSEYFQLLADNINDAFWIRSAELRELYYVSPGFERIWGRPVSALYEHPEKWTDYIVPEDRSRVVDAFSAFIDKDQPLDIEYCIVRPDGEVRWVCVRGYKARDDTGRPIRLVGIVSDITEKRHIEQALRESEDLMRLRTTALDAAANGVIITDRAGNIQWVNTAFTRLTGYTSGEVIGRNPRLLKSGRQPEASYRQLWEIISRGDVWQGEIVNRRKDGTLYHEEMTITPVRNAAGEISQFIAIKQDITERKRAEASIQDLHQKLLVASRQAGMAEVAADVLHNVGNVLNSVTVSANLLAEQLRQSKQALVGRLAGLLGQHTSDLAEFLTTDPAGRKIPGFVSVLAEALAAEQTAMKAELDTLRENIQHITEIVARQRGRARAVGPVETFHATELVEDALRIDFDGRGSGEIALIRDYPESAPPVLATDRHRAAAILMHLVRNARHACQQSGGTDKKIIVRVRREGERISLAISDNGIGLAPEDIPRIFTSTFPNRKHGPGTGLHGDASAAAELGGTLRAQSEGRGLGATFTLELPCAPDVCPTTETGKA